MRFREALSSYSAVFRGSSRPRRPRGSGHSQIRFALGRLSTQTAEGCRARRRDWNWCGRKSPGQSPFGKLFSLWNRTHALTQCNRRLFQKIECSPTDATHPPGCCAILLFGALLLLLPKSRLICLQSGSGREKERVRTGGNG